jgi:uncharacterized repeat protein (TIGR02543 family)
MPSSRLYIAVLVAAVAAFFIVPAAQAAASGTIKVKVAGSGSGKVKDIQLFATTEPEPIDCPGVCSGTIKEENPFAAEAAFAGAGSEFTGWTITKGAQVSTTCDGGEEEIGFVEAFKENEEFPEYAGVDGACIIEPVSEEAEVTANFTLATPKFLLKVEKTGEGTIVSSPAGIECGGTCSAEFSGTVTLTASPATGYAFGAWAGCTTHVGLTCTVEMSKAKTVKASFIATPSLTVEKAGSGAGKASATGISCDENCSKATSSIKTGTVVTVKVTSAKGSEAASFEGGTGSASGCSGATCSFTISENSSVKVKFAPKPTKTLTVKLTGPAAYKGKVTGKGTVKGLLGSAINCGSGCTSQTESFFSSDEVTLTAVAGTGYSFAGWSGSEAGSCTGTTSPCTIPTNANKTLSAEFK